MNLGKRMKAWQMVVMVGLCVLLSLSMFLPYFGISGKKIANVTEEMIGEMAGSIGQEILGSSYEKAIDDAKEEIEEGVDSKIEKLSEDKGIDLSSISAFDLIMLDKYKLYFGKDYDEKDIEEFETGKAEIEKGDTKKEAAYELDNQLKLLKLFFIILFLGALLVALVIILCFAFKLNKYLPSIISIVFSFIGIIGMLIVRFGASNKLAQMSKTTFSSGLDKAFGDNNFFGSATEAALETFMKSIVNTFFRMGFWIAIGVMVLLIVISVITMILHGAEIIADVGAVDPAVVNIQTTPMAPEPIIPQSIPTQPVNQPIPSFTNQKSAEPVWRDTPAKPAQKPMGRVECTSGVALGQGFKLPEDKKVIVGKSPQKATLVINNQHISNVHCSIRYQAATNTYIVKDYSSNGTFVNGVRLQKEAPMSFPAGTVVSLADGTNQITLG